MEDSSQHVVGVPLAPHKRRPWARYVAIGDSLSEGLGDPRPGGGLRGWAVLLAEHLRPFSPELSFTNLAVRGYRARDAIERELPEAIALQPDLITVFIGGNDVLLTPRLDGARFADELDQLVAPFDNPSVTVVLSTLPDLAAVSLLPPPLRGQLRRRVETVNEAVRRAAHRYDTVLLDAWAEPRILRHAMWSFDHIHPSAAGHRLIAASVVELLGVPESAQAEEAVPASPSHLLRRYTAEMAWLLRHGLERSSLAA
jgi:lysophospholipase L1-like esterase